LKIVLLLVLFPLSVSTTVTQSADVSCSAVLHSITQLRKQLWVQVRGQVLEGVHPEGYQEMTSYLLGGKRNLRVLDGARFGSNLVISSPEELDLVIGASELIPDSECFRIDLANPKRSALTEYTYTRKVARAEARLRLWISNNSGLPVQVQVNGPQLAYGQSLSRPGKPPQVTLKSNGLRYTELLEYAYGETLVRTGSLINATR
jgi:hypothetical protein